MGARFRLKSQRERLPATRRQIPVILVALQRYGMILADNGSAWYISGAPDERWNNDTLQQLHAIVGNQLEAVDESSLMVSPDSGQVQAGSAPSGTATPTPPPGATPTATPSPSQGCSPRPPAHVDVARGTAGRLDVTVAASTSTTAPNNQLHALRFGAISNATINSGTQTIASNARIAFPSGSHQTHFSVQQTRSGEAVTVPLVVEDDCGDWPTFVGGGRASVLGSRGQVTGDGRLPLCPITYRGADRRTTHDNAGAHDTRRSVAG